MPRLPAFFCAAAGGCVATCAVAARAPTAPAAPLPTATRAMEMALRNVRIFMLRPLACLGWPADGALRIDPARIAS
ncbi:hypothetical protein XPN_1029 [Xanthomonas arboricola pv. pruni MAFF 301427]|nr:hypothetical protein XPN_1029 [Xanthomonas arboricola pv. pruni MAFF 301427]